MSTEHTKPAPPLQPGRPRKEDEVLSVTLGFRASPSLKERFQACLEAFREDHPSAHGGDLFRELLDEGLERRGF